MQQNTHHDTSTQAMTEVALGLSMAFFSLLILALFSIGLPEQAHNKPEQNPQLAVDTGELLKLTAKNDQASAMKPTENDKRQYAFYFKGKYYDKQLQQINIQEFDRFDLQQPLILAVQDNLPLLKIMALRKQINHAKLSITTLNQKWQSKLELMQ